MFILITVTLIIWVNLTNSISSRVTQNIDIGDKVCNVQHVSGGFILGDGLSLATEALYKSGSRLN